MDDPSTSTDHGSDQGVPETVKEMELDKDLKQKREMERRLLKEKQEKELMERLRREQEEKGKMMERFRKEEGKRRNWMGFGLAAGGQMNAGAAMARVCDLSEEEIQALRDKEKRVSLKSP